MMIVVTDRMTVIRTPINMPSQMMLMRWYQLRPVV